MPEQLYLITKKFSANFTYELWRLLVWNFRMMATTLNLIEQTQIDIEPHINFLLDYKEVICQHLILERQIYHEQIKRDFIFFVSTVFLYLSDEQKRLFTE